MSDAIKKHLSIPDDQFERWMNGVYRDTGRIASNPGERLSSVLGAPALKGLNEMQKGNFSGALSSAWEQMGKDPQMTPAPSGEEIIRETGITSPWLTMPLGFAVESVADLSNLASGGGKMLGGLIGKVDKVENLFDATRILDEIDTPEKAVALKGAERSKYLAALDEVYGDQAKRAADMGFGDETWYHGTKGNFDEFSKDWLGAATDAPSAKKAIFGTNDPSVAAEYADLAPSDFPRMNIFEAGSHFRKNIPEYEQLKGMYENFDKYTVADIKKIEDLADAKLKTALENYQTEIDSARSQILPLRFKLNNPLKNDFGGEQYREMSYNKLIKEAQKSGNDGVLFSNTFDDLKNNPGTKAHDIAAVFEPNQIRSIHAAFDPRFKDSSHLMAGGLGAVGYPQMIPGFSAWNMMDDLKEKNKDK